MLNKKKLLIIATMVYATVLSAQKPADAKKAVEPAKTTTATELPKGDAKAVTAVNAEFKPLGFLGFAYAEGPTPLPAVAQNWALPTAHSAWPRDFIPVSSTQTQTVSAPPFPGHRAC
ncbi:MAG: hypothetical protein U1F16_15120 [Turneriella sp.]